MARRVDVIAWAVCTAMAMLAKPAAALDLSLPRGAQQVLSETEALGSVAVPTGPVSEGRVPVDVVEGRVTRTAFHIDNSSATLLQILHPIRTDLATAGYDILLDCDEITCGGFEFRFATDVLPAPAMFVDLTNFRALTARRDAAAISFLVSASGPRRFVQMLHVVPLEAEDTEPVAVAIVPDATDPAPGTEAGSTEKLEQDGHIVLGDLTFQTGRTALSDGPYESLGRLAAYLAETPSARIVLVGHTDAVGSLESNIAISKDRAEAVRNRLISEYGIAEDRLSARGIGFLSPRATNLTDAGRALNRRVEAVLLGVE